MPITGTSVGFPDLGSKVASFTHPVYDLFLPQWIKLAHVREGVGGFLDGTYLVAHPREWEDFTATTQKKPTKKLKARRALACYENFAATIIESKRAALFRQAATRRVGPDAKKAEPSPLEQWWEDVDGRGCHIDDYMAATWDLAATFGHMHLLLDRAPDAEGMTAADRNQPFLRQYAPLDVLDWLEDEYGHLTAVKLQEQTPRDSLDQMPRFGNYRIRIVTQTDWKLYSAKGEAIEQGTHNLGVVPIVTLFGRRRPIYGGIGQSVLGDPQRFVDLYNITSEIRELLRSQTFSWINVPLGSGDNAMTVEAAKTMLGQEVGTNNVIFSGLAAQILSADAANVTVYQAEKEERLRAIYREAAIQWEADTKNPEAHGSLQLKREDMNTRLASYADECEQTEYAIAKLWYRDQFGADMGPQRFDDEQITIRYPDSFDMTPFDDVLAQAQSAMALGMPAEFLKELRKSLVTKFLPDLDETTLDAITTAIANAPADLTPAEQMKMKLQATAAALKGAPTKEPLPGEPAAGKAAA